MNAYIHLQLRLRVRDRQEIFNCGRSSKNKYLHLTINTLVHEYFFNHSFKLKKLKNDFNVEK